MKTCLICGTELRESVAWRKYCTECASHRHEEHVRDHRRKERYERVIRSAGKLAHDADAAMAEGMTYGEYMARKNQKRRS